MSGDAADEGSGGGGGALVDGPGKLWVDEPDGADGDEDLGWGWVGDRLVGDEGEVGGSAGVVVADCAHGGWLGHLGCENEEGFQDLCCDT